MNSLRKEISSGVQIAGARFFLRKAAARVVSPDAGRNLPRKGCWTRVSCTWYRQPVESVQFSTCGNTLRIVFAALTAWKSPPLPRSICMVLRPSGRLSVENRTDFAVRQRLSTRGFCSAHRLAETRRASTFCSRNRTACCSEIRCCTRGERDENSIPAGATGTPARANSGRAIFRCR